jgi:hypothetical protein
MGYRKCQGHFITSGLAAGEDEAGAAVQPLALLPD